MEREVEDGVFDEFIIVVYLLEVVQSCLLYHVVALHSLHCIEVGNFKCEDIQSRMFEDEPVLSLDSSFVSVEEGQELSI